MTLLLVSVTRFRNWLLYGHILIYPSSASVQLDHFTPSGQFDMSYPYINRWPWCHPDLLFSGSTIKKLGKNLRMCDQFHISAAIFSQWQWPGATAIARDPFCRAMRLVLYRQTARASITAGKYGAFLSFFLVCNLAVCPGQYNVNIHPMTLSSGFEWSSEPPSSGGISGVVLAHHLKCRNGSDGGAFVHRQWFCNQPNCS